MKMGSQPNGWDGFGKSREDSAIWIQSISQYREKDKNLQRGEPQEPQASLTTSSSIPISILANRPRRPKTNSLIQQIPISNHPKKLSSNFKPTALAATNPHIIILTRSLRQKFTIESLIIAFHQYSTPLTISLLRGGVDGSWQAATALRTHTIASHDFLQIIIPSVLGIQSKRNGFFQASTTSSRSFYCSIASILTMTNPLKVLIITFEQIWEMAYPCDMNFQCPSRTLKLQFRLFVLFLPCQHIPWTVPTFHQPKKQKTQKAALPTCCYQNTEQQYSCSLPLTNSSHPHITSYCPAERRISLEISFFRELQTREQKYCSNYFEKNRDRTYSHGGETKTVQGKGRGGQNTRRSVKHISFSDGWKLSLGQLF